MKDPSGFGPPVLRDVVYALRRKREEHRLPKGFEAQIYVPAWLDSWFENVRPAIEHMAKCRVTKLEKDANAAVGIVIDAKELWGTYWVE